MSVLTLIIETFNTDTEGTSMRTTKYQGLTLKDVIARANEDRTRIENGDLPLITHATRATNNMRAS